MSNLIHEPADKFRSIINCCRNNGVYYHNGSLIYVFLYDTNIEADVFTIKFQIDIIVCNNITFYKFCTRKQIHDIQFFFCNVDILHIIAILHIKDDMKTKVFCHSILSP